MENNFKYLYQILLYRANNAAEEIYITTEKDSMTYLYAWKYSLSVATFLNKINDNDPIIIQCTRPINFVLAFWGCIIRGNHIYIGQAEKNYYTIDDSIIEYIRNSTTNYNNDIFLHRHNFSIYLNSSGTTNKPHIIQNTEQQFVDAINSIKRYPPMDYLMKKGCAFISVKPTHSFGLSSIVEYTLGGYRLFMPESFQLISLLKSISQNIEKIDTIAGTPFLLQSILKLLPDLCFSSLKQIILGTDMIPYYTLQMLLQKNLKMNIICRYGLSELPSVISASIVNNSNIKTFSPQLLSSCLDIYQLEYQTYDNYTELIIKDYNGNKYRTGDNIIYNKDGFLLQGRCSSIFKYNGYKINSNLIEQELKDNECNISDCVLFLDCNKLTLKIEAKNKITEAAIIILWKKIISCEFLPDKILFVDKINRTETGKKVRHAY